MNLAVFVNNACNLKCSYCDMRMGRDVLSLDQLKGLTDGEHFSYTTVLGGEPMLVKNIWEYMRYLLSLSDEVKLITNGWFTDYSELKRIKGHGVILGLSMDSEDSEKSQVAMGLLKFAKEVGVRVSVNFLYIKNVNSSIHRIIKAAELAEEVHVGFLASAPTDEGIATPDGMQTEDLDDFIQMYETIYDPEKMFVRPDTMRRFQSLPIWHCDSRYARVIFPDGSTSSCCMWKGQPEKCPGCKNLCDMELESR